MCIFSDQYRRPYDRFRLGYGFSHSVFWSDSLTDGDCKIRNQDAFICVFTGKVCFIYEHRKVTQYDVVMVG